MWRLALGTILSLTPSRWRAGLRLNEAIPWVRATVLSGFLESLLAFFALIDWYSHSVTTWAANALDSALRNGPERAVPGQAIGFSALVLWVIHPLTWLIGFFVIEGLLRLLAAAFTEQIFGTAPLAFADWCYGKVTGRSLDGEALLEIHSSRAKAEWIPPRTVRIGDTYFRLEQLTQGNAPRPFVFRLRRVAAGAPGRTVIVYESPREV